MVGNSCHEFFKVYLSHISSKQLVLPPAFGSNLKGTIRKNCTIKDSDGKIWKVKLEGSEVGLVVVNGWEEFASHHLLVDGDFLVFDYDGDSHFDVKIYGMNGLRKRKAPDTVASRNPAKRGRKQGVEQERTNSRPRSQEPQPRTVYKTRNSKMPLKETPTGLGCHGQFRVKLNRSRSRALPRKAEEAASNFTSAYPYFKAVITSRSLVGDLSVPRNFVKNHIKPKMDHTNQMIKKLPETKLLVANSKWSVTLSVYFKYGSYGKIAAGWTRFVCDNCLEFGDECFFELINNDPVTMKVSIFKHNGDVVLFLSYISRRIYSSKLFPIITRKSSLVSSLLDVVPPKAEEAITTPSYPYFKAVMCPGYLVSCMAIPPRFVMGHIKPKVESAKQQVKKVIETQLLVVDNKWIVHLNVYFNHRVRCNLSAGWRKFFRDNCLEVGDECLFELINTDPVTMKVSISKHNSE